jgi:hypothetical protein
VRFRMRCANAAKKLLSACSAAYKTFAACVEKSHSANLP